MKIFLDFDRTLYDLDVFHVAARELLAAYGISHGTYDASKKIFSTVSGMPGGMYTPERHEAEFRNITGEVKRSLAEGIRSLARNGQKFVFDDVHRFFRKTDGHERIILTFGDDEYQRYKIAGTGLDLLADDVIVTAESKRETMRETLHPGERGIFVDDHSGYFSESFGAIDVTGIHLVRSGNGHSRCAGCYADFHADDLDEVSTIIENLRLE